MYCYDPRFFALSPWGLTKTGPHRAAFLQQCVADLQASLQQLGSGLLVAVGKPEEVIAAALDDVPTGSGLVLAQEEVTSEELAVDAKVTRAIKVCCLEGLPVQLWQVRARLVKTVGSIASPDLLPSSCSDITSCYKCVCVLYCRARPSWCVTGALLCTTLMTCPLVRARAPCPMCSHPFGRR